MSTTRRNFIKTAVAGTAGTTTALAAQGKQSVSSFRSASPTNVERVFVGPEFWANRLQDWRLKQGRIECVDKRQESPMRALHLLTHRLGDAAAAFTLKVRTGLLDEGAAAAADAATGFLIGAGGATMDYRAAALIHQLPGPGGR